MPTRQIKPKGCACYGSNDIHECFCNLKNNNMKSVTAVEWLVEQLSSSKYIYKLMEEIQSRSTIVEPNGIIQQAKAMEKEQIEDAWIAGMKSNQNNFQGI